MKIEILINTYNRLNYLKLCLNSALGQTDDNYMVTVVNSNSTDETKQYLNSINDNRLRVLHFNNNLGITGNIERAISQSNEDLIVLFHDDDLMEPDFIEHYRKNIEDGVVLYHCDAVHIDEDGQNIQKEKNINFEYIEKNGFIHGFLTQRKSHSIIMPSVMIDTRALKSQDNWPLKLNKQFSFFVDLGLWVTLNKYGKFKFLPRKLIQYRHHPKSNTTLYSTKHILSVWRNRSHFLALTIQEAPHMNTKVFALLYFLKSLLFDLKKFFLRGR